MSPATEPQRQAVVEEALSWLGTPYHHAARVKGAGVDCAMLLAEVYELAGVLGHVDPEPYPADWHMHRNEERYLAHVRAFCQRIAGPPKPGDVALFKVGRCVSHGAIVVEWPVVVHAYVRARAVVLEDALANQELAPRLVGFWSPWAHGGEA